MNKLFPVVFGVAVLGVMVLAASSYRARPSVSGISGVSSVSPQPSAGADETTARSLALVVVSPVNGSTVSSASIAVKGRASAGAEIFVNDSETRADANGNFSVRLTLEEGDNYILVVANDASGAYAEKELNITYTP